MEFQDEIAGGVSLVRPALQSPDYEPGASGWSVKIDGSAEFNNVVIRGGTVVSGTQLYYDPAPGPGTLVMSIAAEAGTDEYGNAYERGIAWYEGGTTVVQAGDALASLLGMAGVTSYDADTTRLSALTNGSVAFLPLGAGQTFTLSAAVGMQYLSTTTPHAMRLLMTSGRTQPRAVQQSALIALDSATDTDRPEITMYSETDDGAFLLDVHGDMEITGQITAYDANTFTTWSPTITGGGAATFSTAEGWWQRIGKMIFVYAYLVVGTAGTGTTALGATLPAVPWRGSANRRQMIPGNVTPSASPPGPLSAVVFAGSTGATVQRLVLSDGSDATGADLAAGSIWTIQGWYREA